MAYYKAGAVFQAWGLFIFVNRNKNEPKNARPAKLPPALPSPKRLRAGMVKQYRDPHPPYVIVPKLPYFSFNALNLIVNRPLEIVVANLDF